MTNDFTAPVTEHSTLLGIVTTHLGTCDPSPVQAWALRVVKAQLEEHHPEIDDSRATGLVCLECWDAWPCKVYELIETESRRDA